MTNQATDQLLRAAGPGGAEPLPDIPFVDMGESEYEQYVAKWIGIPYHLNGEDPTIGLDCRTLAIQFLRGQGINIKGTDDKPLPETIDQLDIERYEKAVHEAGATVALSDLKRNDIVWYYNKNKQPHVGVWLGSNRILTTGFPYKSFIYKLKPEQLAGAVRGTHGIWLDDRKAVPAPPAHPPVVAVLAAVGAAVTLGAAAGTAAVVIGAIVVAGTLAGAVYFGLGALGARKAFDFSGTAASGLSASQRYAFDGARNIRSNQQPVPLIYSGLGIRILQTYEIWNSGSGSATQKRLVLIGEGELGSISEVQLNGSDIAGFTGCSFTAYTGTAAQAVDSRAAGSNVLGLKNTAYLGITLAASEKLSGDPVITCKVTGRKINTWNGTNWTAAAPSASGNPAAAIRDYLTLSRERGGCGFPTSAIDDASFGAVYDWAEVTVTNLDTTTEPRARLDMIIDASRPWLDNLQDMLATFGGFIVTDGRKFYLRVEKSESPTQAFTDDQIWDLEYQTFPKDDRPNRIVGVYIDPTAAGNDARTRVAVDDLTDQASNPRGIVPTEVNLLGLSRQNQAIREITKMLNDLKVNWYSLSFTTDVNALAIEPGDVITVTHPVLGDGVTAYSFRVQRITENEDHSRRIVCKAYNSSIFGDTVEQQSVTLTYVPPVNPFTALPDVTGLTLNESTTVLGDGTLMITADASWTAIPDPMFLKHYEVAIKKSTDGSYTVLGFTKETTFTCVWDFIVGGSYTVRIRSVNQQDVYSTGAISGALVISGTPPAPANVANFAATFTDEIVFTWDKNTEANLIGYEIRTENANFGVQSAALVFRGLVNKFTIVTPSSRSPGTYYIKAYNTSGVFSATAQSVTPTNAAPGTPTVATTQWFGFAKLEWTDVADTDLLYYEVYKSATNAWAGEEVLEARVSGTEAIVQGKAPVDAIADSANSTSITDDAIAGKGTNYFVGDRIKQTTGAFSGQEATVTAYNNTTGQVTVASWPSGTPSAGDKFVLKDRAHFKVRAVDTFGAGTLSSAQTVDFTPLAEAELGDQVISARKLITGELITLSAQIKDAIITNAKILDLDGGKITANTITAGKMNVSTLSAITADLGTITAGTVTGATLRTAASGRRVVIDADGVVGYDASGNRRFAFLVQNVASFADAGDVIIGDKASNKYVEWDESAGTLKVRGIIDATDISAGTITADKILGAGLAFQNVEVFTASGTFTQPASVTKVYVRAWGGGGGGGGGAWSNGTNQNNGAGGGGGAGEFREGTVTISGNVTVTIGAAGSGGAGSTSNTPGTTGGNGGDTTFGTHVTAKGGSGGQGGQTGNPGSGGSGGAAGTGGSGTTFIFAQSGFAGVSGGGGVLEGQGGNGGAAFGFGGGDGGAGDVSAPGAGKAAAGFAGGGGGGGSAATGQSGNGGAGGNGAPGLIIVAY